MDVELKGELLKDLENLPRLLEASVENDTGLRTYPRCE